MKLATFKIGTKETYGAVDGDGVMDLGGRLGAKFPDVKALLEGNGITEAQSASREGRVDAKLTDITFLPVIRNPGKIICIGHNYEEHRLETQREKSEHPTVFLRLAESLTGHDRPLLCPHESKAFDYEGEIAIVIGKPGRRIQEADAWQHIAGYACFNDGSVRDWQRHTTQFTPGKNFVETGAFGPWMVTADELPPGTVMSLTTRLNGQVMQKANYRHADLQLSAADRLLLDLRSARRGRCHRHWNTRRRGLPTNASYLHEGGGRRRSGRRSHRRVAQRRRRRLTAA